ncbi:hypothetical protein [Phycicoccus sp. Soil748]|uniref:hypothetical protein n=1 Tax=Phycicoccus sp. Soil748 TaxID=1736397 RepID=UPI000703AFDB|nr:hypothetical protein [Phycicoccus sp. Soil748]KRE54961.1 hypothetical protein ASG70_05810 [Phycicoccus sp. Soil748]
MTDTASEGPGAAPAVAGATPADASAGPAAVTQLNVTALFAEAAAKSGLMWVQPPGDRAWPFWHAWADDTVYVVSGPGEQTLPWLPAEVVLVLRSKHNGGRLLTVNASVREVGPQDEQWAAATEALKAGRLNATDDVVERWSRECTVRAVTPFGAPLEAPGSYGAGSGAAPVPPSDATTSHWRPWHWRGRPRRRRGSHLPAGD